jgi:hypothetical protein
VRLLIVLSLGLLLACTGASSSSGPAAPACSVDADCADSVACTRDACAEGACRHDPEPLACDDGNACTRDACHPTDGCLNLPDREGQACDDANGCTTGDTCVSGACLGSAASCDDGDPCTLDGCDAEQGACTQAPAIDGTPCDDGDPCTSGDACAAGACVAGATFVCACAVDADCESVEDGDRCNGTLVCAAHACVVDAATVVTCDASGDTTCQKTVCERATGACVALAVHETDACEPDDRCATTGTCAAGVCQPTAFVTCDDGNACTDDACDPLSGTCTFAPVGVDVACDDGDACTTVDHCNGEAACVGAEPVACDDANPCTHDLCKPSTGECVFAALTDGAPCDDGDPCTGVDLCVTGACAAGQVVPGCCHATDECAPPGACRDVVCGPAHTCDVTVQPDCCGNGTVEDGEICEPGVDAAPGACSEACAWQSFAIDLGLQGSVRYAHVAPHPSAGGYRAVVTLDDGPTPGLYLVDLDGGGSRVGPSKQVVDTPTLFPRVVVTPAVPEYDILVWEMTGVLWHEPAGIVSGRGFVGPGDVPSDIAFGTTAAYDVAAVDDPDHPVPGRLAATGYVQSTMYDFAPTLGYVAGLQRTDVSPDGPAESRLALARARWIGSGNPNHPEDVWMTSTNNDALPYPESADVVTSGSGPQFVRLGAVDNLVYVRVDLFPTAAVRLVRQPFEDDVCRKPVDLWRLDGATYYPFSPAVVEGADPSYALAFLPVQVDPAAAVFPLGLLRLGYDGTVEGPTEVLAGKTTASSRFEGLRLGPDRVALVFDVLELPDGMEVPETVRVGLSTVVLDDQGATVAGPFELLAPSLRRLPDWWVLPRGDGFAVFFVERDDGVGSLRARFVTTK